MAVVSSHQVGVFNRPALGPAVNANDVRGNDNALQKHFSAHDADATIHVQSSEVADRPAAGEEGRVWLTTDPDPVLSFDDGADWVGVSIAGNAATATALETTRSLWGQSFDGTADVSGRISAYAAETTILNLRNTLGTVNSREWSWRVDAATGSASFRSVLDNNTTVVSALTFAHATGAATFTGTVSVANNVLFPSVGSAIGAAVRAYGPNNSSASLTANVPTGGAHIWWVNGVEVGRINATALTTAVGLAVTGNSTITGTLGGITTLTATDFIGDLTGNADTATLAAEATALETARDINGVAFDGTAAIDVPNNETKHAAAGMSDHTLPVGFNSTEVLSESVTVAVGDTVIVEFDGTILNESGSVNALGFIFDLGGFTLNVGVAGAFSATATNRRTYHGSARYTIAATNDAGVVGEAREYTASASGASGALTGGPQGGWGMSGSDLTGAQTLTLDVSANVITAAATFTLHGYRITIIPAT